MTQRCMNNPGAMPCKWQDQPLGTASRGKILLCFKDEKPFLPQVYRLEHTLC